MNNRDLQQILRQVGEDNDRNCRHHQRVDVFVDNPKVRFEEVRAHDGVVDIIVVDASKPEINNTTVYGFNPKEDHLLFVGMKGNTLYAAGNQSQSSFVPLNGSHDPHDSVVLAGTPYSVNLAEDAHTIVAPGSNIFFSGTFV